MTGTDLSTLRSLPDVVAEYDVKRAALPEAIATFEAAGRALHVAASVGGEYGQETIDTGRGVHLSTLERNLLRSAWMHVWKGLNLPQIASAKDKKNWEMAMASPAPFTLDNLRATFAPYLENPRATILRGLAEVFAELDPAYKSHEKVKIGVKGLPKRVILSYCGSAFGHGQDQLRNIINALAAVQGKPLIDGGDMAALREDGDALIEAREVLDPHESTHVHRRRAERGEPPKTIMTVGRGIWVRWFQNGNAHLFFGPEALRDINLALAEFYGDVLPDSPEADAERPAPRATGTAVSKDLQFYPTPKAVIDRVIADLGDLRGKRVLEPSCGDGRIMDALRDKGAQPFGIEVDPFRAGLARAKGHGVMTHNFLTIAPQDGMAGIYWREFDLVVMNPPFCGKHYAKHVSHATRFLKPGGLLVAILPITARTDHGLLGRDWAEKHGMQIDGYYSRDGFKDLPVGSFRESGTGINTTIFRAWKNSAPTQET